MQPVITGGMARGGPRTASEDFLRFAAVAATFDGLEPALRERMLGNGETLFGMEFGRVDAYLPDDDALAVVQRPLLVAAGEASPPFMGEAARWLAARLSTRVETLPGGHMPYLDRPEATAAALRPLLRGLS